MIFDVVSVCSTLLLGSFCFPQYQPHETSGSLTLDTVQTRPTSSPSLTAIGVKVRIAGGSSGISKLKCNVYKDYNKPIKFIFNTVSFTECNQIFQITIPMFSNPYHPFSKTEEVLHNKHLLLF